MLYELLAVVRPSQLNKDIKDIARVTGALILSHNGVVRSVDNWGTFLLTKPVKKAREWYGKGHHFVMRFDGSPDTQTKVREKLGLDPRILRFGIVRMGDKNGTLASTANIRGAAWSRLHSEGARTDLGSVLDAVRP